MEKYYNNGNFRLYISNSNIKNAGLGVFAGEFIKKYDIIGTYDGKNKDNGGDYTYIREKGKAIDASDFPRCYSAMINDSIGSEFFNNCIFSEDNNIVYIMAIQNIKEDEELFISYGLDYWRGKFNNNPYDAYENTCKKLLKKPNNIQLKKEKDFLHMK
jgi:SET domain-containing protein